LHIARDEKFINEAFAIFNEAAPDAHRFAIIDPPAVLTHVMSFHPARIALVDAMRSDFLATLPRYRAVFLHGLTPIARWIVANAPPNTRFVWIGWGADYYHLIRSRDELLLPATSALVHALREQRCQPRTRRRLRLLLRIFRRPMSLPYHLARLRLDRALHQIGPGAPGENELLAKIALFAPVLREEYAMITAAWPGFVPRLADWNYGINTTLRHARRQQAPPLGRDILLGNSATPENNHADAFALLGDVDIGERRVVCPLGYGDADYAHHIVALGRERLGEAFVPLTGFVAPPDYADLMRSCGLVVMNHVRQQALGTINASLCNGAKVFLRPENPIHGFLCKLGIRVFAIGTIGEHLRPDAAPLSEDDIAHARAMIEAQFGPATLHRKTVALLHACAELQ
jgi:hypothetical protein